jgi:hypothetical protein
MFINYDQTNWDLFLALTEFAYNSAVHSSTKLSPFQVVYNRQPYIPTSLLNFEPDLAYVPAVRTLMIKNAKVFAHAQKALLNLNFLTPNNIPSGPTPMEELAHQNATKAQETYTKYANQHCKEVTIKEGDFVLLSTQQLELNQFTSRTNRALSAKYIGPYEVIRSFNGVSFELALPGFMQLHRSFHASHLKPSNPPRPAVATTTYIPEFADVAITAITGQRVHNSIFEYQALYSNGKKRWIPGKYLEQCHQLIIHYENNAYKFV